MRRHKPHRRLRLAARLRRQGYRVWRIAREIGGDNQDALDALRRAGLDSLQLRRRCELSPPKE